MRKGEATRARIVEEAARQAAVRGLSAVSLADVADAIGLSKSGLFKHFDSKEAMQLAVVEHIMDLFRRTVWAPAEPLDAGRARLERMFEGWLDWEAVLWAKGGCPIAAFSVELDDQPGPVREALQQGLRRWRKTVMREFQALGQPPLPEEAAHLAYFQMKSFALGHLDARRIMADSQARAHARSAFDALLARTAPTAA